MLRGDGYDRLRAARLRDLRHKQDFAVLRGMLASRAAGAEAAA